MHHAGALPQDDLHVRVRRDPSTEVLVGEEDHAIRSERLDDLNGVARRAADVGLRFDLRRGIHVGDDGDAGVTFPEEADIGRGDRVGERTPGFDIRNQNRLRFVDDLGGLRHEVNTGHDDHVRLGVGGHPREREGVALEIGDAVEDVRRHVVVREHDRLTGNLELLDLFDDRRERGDLDVREDPSQAFRGADLSRGVAQNRFDRVTSSESNSINRRDECNTPGRLGRSPAMFLPVRRRCGGGFRSVSSYLLGRRREGDSGRGHDRRTTH
jgi:hypothetical protein